MQLHYESNVITTNVPAAPKAFGIISDPVAYDILSHRLYTNKVAAVIREISCNAWDAHIKIGNTDKPFEVKLPNSLDLNLSIRDYGPGLSPTAMIELMTSYFGSDKRHSDELIGGLGLGSKSPFAYTNSYTIISIWKNTKYLYSCFRGEDLIPNCLLINQEPTNEPSGIEVIIPVEAKDCWNFQYEGQRVLQWFPKVTCNVPINPPRWVHKTENGGIIQSGEFAGKTKILQGFVAYDVDLTNILKSLSVKPIVLNKCGLMLFTPIGELNVAASREHLSLDPATIQRLTNRLETAYQEIHQWLQSEIDVCPTKLTALQKFQQFHEDMGFAEAPTISYRGAKLQLNLFMDLELPEELRSEIESGNLKIDVYKPLRKGKYAHNHTVEKSIHFSFQNNKSPNLFKLDRKVNAKLLGQEITRLSSGGKPAVVITCNEPELWTPIYDFFEQLPIVDLSYLRSPQIARSRGVYLREYRPVTCKRLRIGGVWEDFTTREGTTYYSLPLFKGKIGTTNTVLDYAKTYKNFYELIDKFWLLPHSDRFIVGIQATTQKRFIPENCVDFAPEFINHLTAEWENYDPQARLHFEFYHDVYAALMPVIQPIKDKLNPNNPLFSFICEVENIQIRWGHMQNLDWLATSGLTGPLGLPLKEVSTKHISRFKVRAVEVFNHLIKFYPTLGLFPDTSYNSQYLSLSPAIPTCHGYSGDSINNAKRTILQNLILAHDQAL